MTRKQLLWLCGASTAGVVIAIGRIEVPRRRLMPPRGSRANTAMAGTDMREPAEQTRNALAALTPSEVEDLRKGYGLG
jgi:hypothetical protein